MKLILKTNQIKKTINNLNNIVSDYDPISENTGIFVEAYENKITLKAKNKNLVIKTTLNIENQEFGNFLIKAKTFNEAINKITEEELVLEKNKNNSIKIKTETLEFKLNLLSGNFEYLPKSIINFKKIFSIKTEEFKKSLKSILFCATEKNSRIILRSVNFVIKNNALTLVATDDTKIGYSKIDDIEIFEETSFSLPLAIIKDLLKIVEQGTMKFFIDEEDLIIINNNIQIDMKIFQNNYPNVLSFIPKKFQKTLEIEKDILLTIFNQGMLINNIKTIDETPIKLFIMNNLLKIETQDEGIGNVTVTTKKYKIDDDENFNILFNPKFLIESVKSMETKTIEIKFNSYNEPFLVKAKDKEDHEILILPFGN